MALAAGFALLIGLGGGTVASGDAGPGQETPAAGGWTKPTDGTISSPYGERCLGGCRMHRGTDLGVDTGTVVVAAGNGIVDDARCASSYCDRPGHLGLGGYGNLVTITHAGGVETRYAHLERFTVAPGQRVTAGDTIGYSGSTGNSTGPHLHFEVKVNGEYVDPAPFMRERGAPLDGAAP
ncbi:M23 family metallopeptidase [Actinoplanes missouriensis]|uniref:M23 family metallopeptidase n=1 Tax=Actinoplanes missouriensis TaxID=1866 RepID=UPI0033E63421